MVIGSTALLNHYGIKVTTILTDFSGYLIFGVATLLTVFLIAFAPHLDFSRLFTFTNFTGTAGGGVWPQTNNMLYAFVVGLLLVTYTITGYDASAHTSEETRNAAVNVPKGMWQAVLWSMIFGYILVCAQVLAMPDIVKGAAQGYSPFAYIMSSSTMPIVVNVILVVGVVISNYLCGLACITSCSRMMYAFARDGGLPFSKGLSHVSTIYRTPTVAIWTSGLLALLSCLYGGAFAVLAAGCAVFLYISYIMPIVAGLFAEGRTWKERGPFNLGALSKPNAILAILGGLVLIWVGFQPPNDAVGRLIIGLVIFMVVLWFVLERVAPFEGVPQGQRIVQRQAMIAETESRFKDSAAD